MSPNEPTATIIVNYKKEGVRDTLMCLESLLNLDTDNNDVFVVDNGSADESVPMMLDWSRERLPALNVARVERGKHPIDFVFHEDEAGGNRDTPCVSADKSKHTITLIKVEKNRGFAAGNNVGLRYALRGQYQSFWILNNDTEVLPDALYWLLQRINEDPKIGMCGSTLLYADEPETVQNLGGAGFSRLKGKGHALGEGTHRSKPVNRSKVEDELRFVSGASMLVTRQFLERVGLMQEDYFLFGEELDWAFRGRNQFRLGYAPQSIVYHKVGAAIGTRVQSPLSEYYMTRNRIKICLRFSKVSLPFVLLDLCRVITRYCVRGHWDRAKLIARAVVGLPYQISMPIRLPAHLLLSWIYLV
jgi:GT2 family glycosyltransferase